MTSNNRSSAPTTWWFHPALGLVVALLTMSLALPGAGSIIAVAVGLVLLTRLAAAGSRRAGAPALRPVGPRSKRLLQAGAGVLVVALSVGLVIKFTDVPMWWLALTAVVAFVVTVALGYRFDAAVRAESA